MDEAIDRPDTSREYVLAWAILALGIAMAAPYLVRRLVHVPAVPAYCLEALAFLGTIAFFAIYRSQGAPEGWRLRLLLAKPMVSSAGLAWILLSNWGVVLLGAPLYMLAEKVLGKSVHDNLDWKIYDAASPAWKVAITLVTSVGPAVGEELLFRGYLQTGLMRSFRAPIAILITAVLFSAGHLPVPRALGIIPHALWLGFITARTSSLVPAMLCHFLGNVMPDLTDALRISRNHVMGATALLGAVTFPLALRALKRTGTS